jgi:hypothetical protein
MNKKEALNRLSALETEAKALREIIEAPEKAEGLWRPDLYGGYYGIDRWGDCERCVYEYTEEKGEKHLDNKQVHFGNCFPSREIAEKAAPLMARANKIIAAALQVDPEAGPFVEGSRCWSIDPQPDGTFRANDFVFDWALPAFVHTEEQGKEMARILNAEGVR